MNILIANDDGINAKGIHVLADALAGMDDVNIYVCAPDRQRSCCGHALTMGNTIYLKEHDAKEFNNKVLWAAECTGVPADCVRLALYYLSDKGIKIDLVCAGINMGANYGTDFYYSGTLAAAREANVCFTQSIAFSLCTHEAVHFEHFAKIVPEVIRKAYGKLPVSTVLNVNIPDLPADKIKGMKICKMGRMDYGLEYFETEDGGYCVPYDILEESNQDPECDTVNGYDGYITLSAYELLIDDVKSNNLVRNLDIKL